MTSMNEDESDRRVLWQYNESGDTSHNQNKGAGGFHHFDKREGVVKYVVPNKQYLKHKMSENQNLIKEETNYEGQVQNVYEGKGSPRTNILT